MSYKKRSLSNVAETAQVRIQGARQIDQDIDFGNGLTLQEYVKVLGQVIEGTNSYNMKLTEVDAVGTKLDMDEKHLSDFNSRFLNAVGSRYGYDSIEYERLGGKRSSDIKRSSRKAKA